MRILQSAIHLTLGENVYTREQRDGVWHAIDAEGLAHVERDLVQAYAAEYQPEESGAE